MMSLRTTLILAATAALLLILGSLYSVALADSLHGARPLEAQSPEAQRDQVDQLAQRSLGHVSHPRVALAGALGATADDEPSPPTYPIAPRDWESTADTMVDRAISQRRQVHALEQLVEQQTRTADALEQLADQGIQVHVDIEQPPPAELSVDMEPIAEAIELLAERMRQIGDIRAPDNDGDD